MKGLFRTAAIAAGAFALGLALGWTPAAVHAAAAPLQPQVIDLTAITAQSLTPLSAYPTLRAKTLVVTDNGTIAIQMGTAPKHYHADANEIQVVIGGSGTEWLGDKQVPLAPGTMVVIPKGTTHAGLTDAGNLKFISIKMPPQDPSDVHPVQ